MFKEQSSQQGVTLQPKMPAPTLGCQIAPDYNGDHYDSEPESDIEDDSIVTEEEERSGGSAAAHAGHLEIEKAETQQITPAPSRPDFLKRGRTRSSRRNWKNYEDPVGFWHWTMAGVRLHVIKLWLRTNLILAVAIMSFLCLFWGALFLQEDNLSALIVWVVNFDSSSTPENIRNTSTTPFVGPFVVNHIQKMIENSQRHVGYQFKDSSAFDYDVLKVREGVYNFDAWAAIVINPNATKLLGEAVKSGNESYDPLGACQIIYNSARDQTTTSSYILPAMSAIQKTVVSNFGREWIKYLLETSNLTDLNLELAPQAISPGIEFTLYDLRPFGPPIATPAVSIGLIYLIVLSFFSFTFFLPIHMKYLSPRGHPPLHFRHLIVWRYVATVLSYFLLSFVYSLVSLAYLMPMGNKPGSHVWPEKNPTAFGKGTFVIYWMTNWISMCAFGLASENMAMLLGTPWTALWLIFWIISNVATGFYPLALASPFYKWGYAWPMHNIVELTRQLLFDLHPRIGLNFGILFAWCAFDTILFPFCCYFMRWKTIRAKKQAANKEEEWHAKMDKERVEPSFLAKVTTVGGRKATDERERASATTPMQ